jgi:hypothetical protein
MAVSAKGYLVRRPGRSDGRAADIGGLGQPFTKEGPWRRTLGRYGRSSSRGDGGAERRRSCRSSAFSSSLPLSLSETSVPSERPVATPTSCAATTRSLTENDKRPVREGVRLGRLPQGHKFRARARGRSRKRSLKAAVPVGAASHVPSKPTKAPSTPASLRTHQHGSPVLHGRSSAVGRARKGQDEAQGGEIIGARGP